MEQELNGMTKAELYKLAQEHDLRGRSRMTKAELISALAEIEGKRRPPPTQPAPPPSQPVPTVEGERPRVGESAPLTSPPPRPSAPQYLTPTPAEVYQGEQGPPLPESIPVTVLEAMPRDPHWIFLYWDVRPEDKHAILTQYGEWIFERSLSVLRVHDVEAESWRDVPVLLDARNWYLPVLPDRVYRFQLGLIVPDGEFVAVASSRQVRTPPAQPSFQDEEEWLSMEEYFRELVELYGEFAPGSLPGSPAGRRLAEREQARFGWSGVRPVSSRKERR